MKNKIFLIAVVLVFNSLSLYPQTLPQFTQTNKETIPKLEFQLNLLYQDFKSLKKLTSEKANYYAGKNILIIDDKVEVEVHLRDKADIEKIDLYLYEIEKDDYYGVFKNIVQILLPIKNLERLSEESYVLYICAAKFERQ